MEIARKNPMSWFGARWSQKCPRRLAKGPRGLRNGPLRPVGGPGGAVSRAGQPPLDPELQTAPLWPSLAAALAVISL